MMLIALRFAIAGVLFTALTARSLRGMSPATVLRGVILGVLLFAGFATQTIGLQYTTASKSGFITGFLVVFTPMFQFLIERRPPRIGNVIGIVLVMIGLYLLTAPEGAEFNLGDGLTLVCAIMFALYIVYLDMFTQSHDVVQLTFLQFLTTALLAAVGAGLEFPHLQWTVNLAFALGYLAILATLYTLFIQTKYQKDTTPTRAAIIFSIEPVFAAVFAYLILGEIIGAVGVLGGGLIVAGLLVSELADVIFPRGERTMEPGREEENIT
jgi:drug/metabolite transporter (DMT)-like permease